MATCWTPWNPHQRPQAPNSSKQRPKILGVSVVLRPCAPCYERSAMYLEPHGYSLFKDWGLLILGTGEDARVTDSITSLSVAPRLSTFRENVSAARVDFLDKTITKREAKLAERLPPPPSSTRQRRASARSGPPRRSVLCPTVTAPAPRAASPSRSTLLNKNEFSEGRGSR